MSSSDDYRRKVAGRFMQATRNITFNLTNRWFPEIASDVTDTVERRVEDEGLLVEGVEVIRLWFRSDDDAKWLDEFWQSPEGKRFLELNAELMMRSFHRELRSELPIPPPSAT